MTDLISRQAAIDALMAWEEVSVWDDECLKHRGEPYWVAPSDVIEQLPTAEPKRGKWIREPYSEGLVTYRCSECMKAMGLGSNKSKWYKFCPNCGADMRGEEDE